ncbi:hypothetical protein HanXRQr2_Chr09g0399581 [Helianthus annuus]|uniref:Uncharacterized protein n=1 Tax=Helianthus annuus TaxID=4232 RepID=A0A9K3N9C5_HELAN|nr:hypothetical protein HanXRQr2_Chr09g0399581 [Helianthus annuus]KAJ0894104.1 hypothetical protein HanPSC8_Chr09g0385371 [Helianthus annuus]
MGYKSQNKGGGWLLFYGKSLIKVFLYIIVMYGIIMNNNILGRLLKDTLLKNNVAIII